MALVNTDLLMNMINDILDYSQMKDNKLRLIISEFSLSSLLGSVYNLMKIQTQLKGINFLIKNHSQPLILNSDQRRIKQILINLLSNAIKFTDKGYIKLIVNSSTFDNRIKLTVQDTGSGISENVLQNLGQPFATFATNTNQNQGGIGLGLNFCKQLIGMLGPENFFHVKTQLGKGSKFSFIIYTDLNHPNLNESIKFGGDQSCFGNDDNTEEIKSEEVASDNLSQFSQKEIYCTEYEAMSRIFSNQDEQNSLEQLSQQVLKRFESNINILIVDDNVFNLLVLKNQLEKINSQFKIFKASNGKQALDTFVLLNEKDTESKISLIIMDCDMPIMNGFESSKRITNKILNENYSHCIIIGYTALVGENEEKIAYESGMNDLLQKPAMFNDLKQKIFVNLDKVHIS